MQRVLHFFIGFSTVLMLLNSCNKIAEFTQFNMDFNESITIPSATGISLPINILTPNMETNSETTFEINNTRKDLIEAINLSALSISVSAPNNADFSFLESISVYINAIDIPEVEIAWENDVPETIGNTLVMNVSGTDLQEFIKKDEFSLRLRTTTDELLTSDYQIEVAASFFVDAEILGL